MNDPTTIPLIQDDVYGPTNSVKENRTSMRGAVYRPDTFNIIGASTDNDHVKTDRTNLRGSQTSNDVSDTGIPPITYNPTCDTEQYISSQHQYNSNPNSDKTNWAMNHMNYWPRGKRRFKKNKVFCSF